MTINTNLNAKKGVEMLEKVLLQEKGQLPEDKTIEDFSGGYVECLKTKAKLALFFGFDNNRNRCKIIIDIDKADVLLWLEAIAEKVWNRETKVDKYNISNGDIVKDVEIGKPKLAKSRQNLFLWVLSFKNRYIKKIKVN